MPAIKTIFFGILFAAGCGIALVNPIWGLVNYMFVYQLDPTDRWWGAPLFEWGVRFSFLAALSVFIGLILGAKRLPRLRPIVSYWELGALALFGIGVGNIALGVGFGRTSQVELEKFGKVLIFTLILARIATSRTNLLIILWTLVLGSLVIGYDALTAPAWAFVQGRLEIIGGPDFSTTSGAASHLTAMLPIIGLIFLITHHWLGRGIALVAGGLTVNAVIMCRTRSAFIGLVIGGLTALITAPAAKRARIYALLGLGAIVAFGLTDEHFWQRMSTLTDREMLDNDLAAVSRREIWVASLHIIADHPLGIGVGNFTNVIGDYDPRHYKRSTHNSLIVCFVELGILGGLIFMSMALGSGLLLWRATRDAWRSRFPLQTQIIAYGLLASLVTYCVTALGTQRFYCESFWWVLALPLCLNRVIAVERAYRSTEPQRSCEEELFLLHAPAGAL